MIEAHLIVGHAASSPLARLRTISFEGRRKSLGEAFFENHAEGRSRDGKILRAVSIIDEWLDGSLTLSRSLHAEEATFLSYLLLTWAIDWVDTCGEIDEVIGQRIETCAKWISDHTNPAVRTFPVPIPWRTLRRREVNR